MDDCGIITKTENQSYPQFPQGLLLLIFFNK